MQPHSAGWVGEDDDLVLLFMEGDGSGVSHSAGGGRRLQIWDGHQVGNWTGSKQRFRDWKQDRQSKNLRRQPQHSKRWSKLRQTLTVAMPGEAASDACDLQPTNAFVLAFA